MAEQNTSGNAFKTNKQTKYTIPYFLYFIFKDALMCFYLSLSSGLITLYIVSLAFFPFFSRVFTRVFFIFFSRFHSHFLYKHVGIKNASKNVT